MSLIILILAQSGFSNAFASLDLAKLNGTWKLACTQNQMGGKQGYIIETYIFGKSGIYQRERKWFKTEKCSGEAAEKEIESGSIKIGKEDTNNGFNPPETYDAEYKKEGGIDQGLIWLDSSGSKLRLARGIGILPNSILGIFQYTRQ